MRRASLAALILLLLAACKSTDLGFTTALDELVVVSPPGRQAGNVPITVIVFSRRITQTGAQVEFSTDGGLSFQPATQAQREPQPDPRPLVEPAFDTSPEGARNIFVWDSLADVGVQQLDDVVIRVVAGSEDFQLEARTDPFSLDNTGWLNVFPPEVEDDWELRSVDFASFDDGLAAGAVTTPARGVLLEFAEETIAEADLLALTQPFELNGVANSSFGQLAVGRNLATSQGLLLQPDVAGDFFSLPVPLFSRGLELLAAEFFAQGRAWVCGATGEGLGRRGVLLLKDSTVRDIQLPVVSNSWELVSVSVFSQQAAFAVGADLTNQRGVALSLAGPLVWEQVELPQVANDWRLNGIDLSAADEGWAVGEDLRALRGVILRLEGGAFSVFASPEISADWTLNGVTTLPDGRAFAVGEDRIARQGLILRFAFGAWERVEEIPVVSTAWELRSVDFPLETLGFAVGADRENLRGVILRLDQ